MGSWGFSLAFLFSLTLPPIPAALYPPETGGYSISQRGPHHRVWEQATSTTNSLGELMAQTNSYTELETGMHYFKDGQWQESRAEIQIRPEGGDRGYYRNRSDTLCSFNHLPFGAVGEWIWQVPESVFVRIKRPTPWRNFKIASGKENSPKGRARVADLRRPSVQNETRTRAGC